MIRWNEKFMAVTNGIAKLKRRSVLSSWLVLSSMIVGLLLVEVSLRVLNLGYGMAPIESHELLHHVHPRSYMFVSHVPGGEYGGHQIYYDQYGLAADPEREATKEANCRIAFLGDSFTESVQVEYRF